jgi:PAS domain S-box-containing protein
MARLERALRRLEPQGRRAEDTLRQRTELVLETVAGVPCAILIANERGRYIAVNAEAVALTGFSQTELLRMSVWDLTPGTRLRLGQRLWADFLRRGRMRGKYPIRRKDGTVVRSPYVAIANVLPGVHMSALVVPTALVRRTPRTGSQSAPATRRTRR